MDDYMQPISKLLLSSRSSIRDLKVSCYCKPAHESKLETEGKKPERETVS